MRHTLLVCLFALMGCTGARTLTILHTNDIHGHFMPERASWRSDSAMVGGFAALSGALDSVRRADKLSIYLDAGDLMTGNPICGKVVDDVEGGALLNMLRLCGCDAGCLGNHEFDLGGDHVERYAGTKQIDLVCANLVDITSGEAICPPHKIIERDGLRIGVIGLLLTDLAGVTSKQAIEDFNVLDIAGSAQLAIDELDPQTDLIVLLTHNGYDSDKELARAVHGCDVIVGGHSHTRLSEPVIENGVLIVQAGSYLKQLGVLEVTVKKDRIESHRGSLVELDAARFRPDQNVAEYVQPFADEIEREYGTVIATASAPITRRYNQSSPLGNLICDLMRNHYVTEFAITNSGGLRKDIAAGPVRKLDCLELMPFVNSVTLFEATGADLQTFATRQAEALLADDREILQMSGLEIQFDASGRAAENVTVLVNGSPIEPDRAYRGVSIDYVLVSQAEKYLGFTPRNLEGTGVLFSEFLMQAFASATQPLTGPEESRLIRRNP